MVVLTDLDRVVTRFTGEPVKDAEGIDVTYRKALVNQLGGYNAAKASGENLMKAYDLGLKIHNAKDTVELDEEQFKFVRGVIVETPMYVAIVTGQVLKMLDDDKLKSKN